MMPAASFPHEEKHDLVIRLVKSAHEMIGRGTPAAVFQADPMECPADILVKAMLQTDARTRRRILWMVGKGMILVSDQHLIERAAAAETGIEAAAYNDLRLWLERAA